MKRVVAARPTRSPEELRQLSYEPEGTGVDLYVSPALTNVSGSRIHWRTVPGLALPHVEEPELDGSQRLVKAAFDRVVGISLLLALPVLVACAVAVRATSAGPAIFRQDRAGKEAETFRIWKLRTMYVDTEARLADLTAHNVHGHDAVLFKIHDDPRITRVGAFLRRYPLDELPQLVNFVLGYISLVGPRPPLRQEVDRHDGHVHRRLLVKPGITGL